MTWLKQFWLFETLLDWGLAEFHSLVPELYANLVLAHDLIEIVLIGWYSAQFRILQDFTSWCEGFPCIFTRSFVVHFSASRSHLDVKLHILWMVNFQFSAWVCSWPRAGALTGYCQPEPWSSTFRYYPLPIVIFSCWFQFTFTPLNHLSIVKCENLCVKISFLVLYKIVAFL